MAPKSSSDAGALVKTAGWQQGMGTLLFLERSLLSR